MRTPVYAQKVTLFPEFVHFIVFKVYISFFVSSCRVLFILHYNFSVDMVISGCVCVRRPIVLRASEMETVALQLCGANAIWYNLCLAVLSFVGITQWAIYLWAALCQPLISFEFTFFSLHLTDIPTVRVYSWCLHWIQLQYATITRSFKSIVRVLPDDERWTKKKTVYSVSGLAALGYAMVSFFIRRFYLTGQR